MSAEIIAFPPQLRIVPAEAAAPNPNLLEFDREVLVEHDGRVYQFAGLFRHLSPSELREVEAALPRSAQGLWDEVVRRWPALAEEIVASNEPVG